MPVRSHAGNTPQTRLTEEPGSTVSRGSIATKAIVITIWGGPTDTWPGANYLASTQVFSNYMETQTNVVHLACSATHGHMWPTQMRDAFNAWFADVFYSHPKGTPKEAFKMIDPPDSGGAYTCKLGRYTDHYNE